MPVAYHTTRDDSGSIAYGARTMTPNPMPPPAAAPQQKKGMPVVLIVVIVAVILCFVIGCLAAIAVPNFIKFQSRAKQSEAKANLRAAYTAEMMFFTSGNKYSESPFEVGFSPEHGNRYLYAFSTEGELGKAGAVAKEHTGVFADNGRFPEIDNDALEKGVPQSVWDECGVQDDAITIVAAGNIDTDSTVDVWSVSTKDRTIDGKPVPAGTPYNHVDDTKE